MRALPPLPRSRFLRLAAACTLAAGLSACMGIDVGSVRPFAAGAAAPAADTAVVSGRIQHLVDGQPFNYGVLDKPHLSLYHRGRRVLMSSPETDAEGRFRWVLPAGDYVVAVVFGGLSPTRQPLPLPDGGTLFVNGVVDPGVGFQLAPGTQTDLGTLVLVVESKAPERVLFGGGRVFGRLQGVRVDAGPTAAGRAPVPPRATAAAVLAPVLPVLLP